MKWWVMALCEAGFDVVVSPKRTKSFKWTVNIDHATLEGLKKSIRGMYQTPALENDGAVLSMINESRKYSPRALRSASIIRVEKPL